ncbi:MAG TPA: sugar phosphate nucleotidyltransferase [Myxococcota bacterium]|nr:sugar phosphate nucleotidyltransferase [Myxococcota bacterium]
MESTQHLFGLLLAGGKGKRFWPLSREDHPKQLLQLFSSMTLIEETYQRIKPMVPLDRIMLATSQTLALRFRRLFNEVESDNFIIEPIPRNTAPCIGVAARRCLARDPDAILAVLPSDHYVADPTMFREILAAAVHHAAMGKIVTLGITPTHPETGYGYIRFGDFEPDPENPECRHRARSIGAFVEKPDPETAFAYLKTGRYLWNSGIFVFKASVILEAFREHMPDVYEQSERLLVLEGRADPDPAAVLDAWKGMEAISIDYGVMEKLKEGVVVIPSSFGWSDVGSWRALASFPSGESQNFECGRVVAVDSKENVLYSTSGLLATIGVNNMVVVVTRGAVLVCPLDRTQDVKALVDEIEHRNLTEFL